MKVNIQGVPLKDKIDENQYTGCPVNSENFKAVITQPFFCNFYNLSKDLRIYDINVL